jgi:hypothetical protein
MRTEKQSNGTGNPTKNQSTSPPPHAKIGCVAAACLLFLTRFLAEASTCTPVSGFVAGGHWTTANSPYCVQGDVQVYGTLIIDPGVTVRFDGNYEFLVGGQLLVNGTLQAPVFFTPLNGTNCWKGIAFEDAVPGSYFNNTIIEGSCQSGVRITNTPPAFTNCIVRKNYSPTHGGGILADLTPGLPLVMDNCLISNNLAGPYNSGNIYGGGIYVDGSLLLVNQSIVVSNRTQGVTGYGGGVFALNGDCTLENCLISFNAPNATAGDQADGVYFDGGSAGTLRMANCAVATNGIPGSGSVSYYGGSVYVHGGNAQLVNCIISANAHEGLYFYSGRASVINCTVNLNAPGHYGIYSYSSAAGVTNSIVYFNNSNGDQIGGNVTTAYSDVQGSVVEPGVGNINYSPGLCPNQSLIQGSPCIDAGSPDPIYNDVCIDNAGTCTPYSRGTTRNDMGAYGGPGACCWSAPCQGLDIVLEPQSVTTCLNGKATFSVGATGSQPITYQWRFHGTNCQVSSWVNIVGATNATYVINSVQYTNAGCYSVRVSNPAGYLDSSLAQLTVTPVCLSGALYMGLSLSGGVPGQKYGIYSTLSLTPPITWTSNATITQTVGGVLWVDTNSPANKPQKYYKAQ